VALKAADPELWRRLRGAYAATSYKEWDLYGAFIERALSWAAPDGEIGLVTPSRWLSAAFAAPLRAHLAGHVRRIVDFGARQLFAGPTTYTALVFFTPAEVPTVEVVRDGARRVLAAATLGSAPWPLATDGRIERLAAVGPCLGQVARIAKGAGTNA